MKPEHVRTIQSNPGASSTTQTHSCIRFSGKLLLPALLALAVPLNAQPWTWTGEGDDNEWTNAQNWDQASAPALNTGNNVVQEVIVHSGDIMATGTRDIGRNIPGSTQTVTGGNIIITGGHRYGVLTGGGGTGFHSGGSILSGGIFQLGVQNGTSATYYLSGDASLTASHFAIASGGADTVATMNQSGGTFNTTGASGSFIGHLGNGTYNLSGGTLTRTGANISIGTGATATGDLNQTGGLIDLVNASLSVSAMNGGVGTYSISNGTINAVDLGIGEGIKGTMNVGENATISFSGDLNLHANGEINFIFGESGISTMSFGGAGDIDPNAEISIVGTGFMAVAEQTFQLISTSTFSATPDITLVGFAQEASYLWNETTGQFSVTVIPEPSHMALIAGCILLTLVIVRRRNRN